LIIDVHEDECKQIVVVDRIMWMNINQYLDEHGCKINVSECHSIHGWRYIMWMNIDEQMMEIWLKVDKF
jgi:hypothetical protein